MQRLQPLQKLDGDYYVGENWRGAEGQDSEEEMSSDDELKQELRKLAGIRRDCQMDSGTGRRQRRRSEFEDDMEDELDRSMTEYTNEHLTGRGASGVNAAVGHDTVRIEEVMDEEMPALEASTDHVMDTSDGATVAGSSTTSVEKSPLKSCMKKANERERSESGKDSKEKEVSDDEEEMVEDPEEDNPIKKMAHQRRKDMKKEAADFYDADEDDDNEKWVQMHRKKTGAGDGMSTAEKKLKESRPKIDDGSDAVLSCPGCMLMLTRDCQRHELYNEQYRAMFVENCVVDKDEQLTIEKSGKEKRRERQRLRKRGVDPSTVVGSTEDDVFLPVRCRGCSTKVAVVDNDDVYHFFNVLAGYA